MNMVDDFKEDDALDALFATAQTAPPKPSDDFLARLMADADASLPAPKSATVARTVPWFATLRGWFAASGLSGAAVLGLWIGFVMPDTFGALSLTTDDTVGLYTFLPGADLSAPELSE